MKQLSFFISLIFLQSSLALASGLSAQQAQTFMQDSGLIELIESLPETMEKQFNIERMSKVNALDVETARKEIGPAARRVNGLILAQDYLKGKQDAESLNGAMTFLASPLGKRIALEEQAASRPEAQLEMQAYMMQMSTTPPSDDRMNLVQNLSSALNADQVILKLMKGTFFSIVDVTEKLNPSKAGALQAELDQEWAKMEPVLTEQFSQFMVMGSFYSYRNATDQDLRDYIKFLKTPSGQAYWRTGLEIIDLYLKDFVVELAQGMSKMKSAKP